MIIAVITIVLLVILVTMIAILNAASSQSEYERMVEDEEQEAFLREWQKKQLERKSGSSKP